VAAVDTTRFRSIDFDSLVRNKRKVQTVFSSAHREMHIQPDPSGFKLFNLDSVFIHSKQSDGKSTAKHGGFLLASISRLLVELLFQPRPLYIIPRSLEAILLNRQITQVKYFY
jgi:3-methyladenine DNA glycosylase Tag